jgi:phage gp45-like
MLDQLQCSLYHALASKQLMIVLTELGRVIVLSTQLRRVKQSSTAIFGAKDTHTSEVYNPRKHLNIKGN